MTEEVIVWLNNSESFMAMKGSSPLFIAIGLHSWKYLLKRKKWFLNGFLIKTW